MFGNKEYEDFLIKNIESALSKIGIEDNNLNEIYVYITKQDEEKYINIIKEYYPKIEVKPIDNSYIGGCKCFSKELNIFVDNTLKLSIDEQVENRRW